MQRDSSVYLDDIVRATELPPLAQEVKALLKRNS
jgi:hypothetical protein